MDLYNLELGSIYQIYTFRSHLVPISAAEGSLKIRSPFGPHFEKFRSPFYVGAVKVQNTAIVFQVDQVGSAVE